MPTIITGDFGARDCRERGGDRGSGHVGKRGGKVGSVSMGPPPPLSYLYVEQPWLEVLNTLVPFLHIPDNKVQCVPGEEALVGGIVYLLAS